MNNLRERWPGRGLIIALLGLALALAGCGGPATRVWPDAPGWSRALLLGRTGAGDPVEIALSGDGRPYFLLAPEESGAAELHLVSLGDDGEIELDRRYDVDLQDPNQPVALWDGAELHLLWISDNRLYTLPVEVPSGDPKGEPRQLSDEVDVDSFSAVSDGQGGLQIWYGGPRRDPGLYAVDMEGGPPQLVDPEGIRPQLALDERGVLHAAWAQLPMGYEAKRFYYGSYPEGTFESGRANLVRSFTVGPSTLVEGPTLGVADDSVHLFWAQIIRTGLQAGSAEARHLTFRSPDGARELDAEQLFVPAQHDLPYEEIDEGTFNAGPRARLPVEGIARTGFIVQIEPLTWSSDENLVAAVTSRMEYLRRKNRRQIGLLFFSGEEPTDYQLLSFTPGDSTSPTIQADAEGQLFVTWMERTGLPGFTVYTATTQPELSAGLNRYTPEDYTRILAESVFGVLSGAILAPLAAAIWTLVPLLLLLITTPVRKDSAPLTHWGSFLSLILALAAFWAAKQATFPQMMGYVPFSAWVPRIPDAVGGFLQVMVPVVIGAVGIAAAWYLTYRREQNSVIYFLLAYAAVDSALSGAVYGVLIYGAA